MLKKNSQVRARVSKSERLVLEKMAQEHCVNISEMIRTIIREAAILRGVKSTVLETNAKRTTPQVKEAE